MNIYFKTYSGHTCKSKLKREWEQFGYEQLLNLFQFLGLKVPPSLIGLLPTLFKFTKLKKGTYVANQGEVANELHFVLSGTVKIFTEEDGKEQVAALISEGGIAVSVSSVLYGAPSISTIVTCQKCRTLCITKQGIDTLAREESEFTNNLVAALLGEALEYQKKITSLLYLQNEEKIQVIYDVLPGLFNTFALKDIASLTGMKAETISRVRKKFSEKQ